MEWSAEKELKTRAIFSHSSASGALILRGALCLLWLNFVKSQTLEAPERFLWIFIKGNLNQAKLISIQLIYLTAESYNEVPT